MEINDDIFFNDRSSQTGFLSWAYERINKEVREIKRLEDEFDTAEWYIEEKRRGRPSVNDDEKRELVQQVDKYRDEGYSYRLACELCDLPPGTYSKWRTVLEMGPYKKGA